MIQQSNNQLTSHSQTASTTHHSQDSANQSHSASTYVASQVPPLQLSGDEAAAQPTGREPADRGQGIFTGAHHFIMTGDNTFIENKTTLNNFMKELLQHTIIGAEFDSSDRDPPPRCHPATRLAIIQRCLDFTAQCHDEEKLRWVVGPAGVGKSAVMQIVAEKVPEGVFLVATIFLSVNGRQDGSKTFITIAYQLATRCVPYRQFIQDEIARDPSLYRKSLSVQFNKFIIEPFIHQHLFDFPARFLILIDGLDECDHHLTQKELLRLISDFCITYPDSPIAWIVASRPESHIVSFFERPEVAPAYIKEEMEVDSNEACEEVQKYLRKELKEVQLASPTLKHKREWPSEHDFTKLATAAGGLFAYASTALRYINNPYHRGPASNLGDVLKAIDAGPELASGKAHPMAQLDALYDKILSRVPADAMIDIKKLLLLRWGVYWSGEPLRMQCNLLGLTEDDAYDAIRHMHSTVIVPMPDKADSESFGYVHKSFDDYLKRAGLFNDIMGEAQKFAAQISRRVIGEVPNDVDDVADGEGFKCYGYGHLKGGPDSCDNISLAWPGDERFEMIDDELKLEMYCDCNDRVRFSSWHGGFSEHILLSLRASMFGPFRHELSELGLLKQVPLWTLNYGAICGSIDLQFKSPTGVGSDVKLSNPWNPDCEHLNRKLRGLQEWQGWTTTFGRFQKHLTSNQERVPDISWFDDIVGHDSHWESFGGGIKCNNCLKRLARRLMDHPDEFATVFVDSTDLCYVELSFLDLDDGVSEGDYRFLHSGSPT